MTKEQHESYMMTKVQYEGHEMATVHWWMQTHCRGHQRMSQVASWSAVRSFPPPKLISIPHMNDHWKHARGCSDILSTNEECSGCWEQLWRSPLWKIQVRLRLSTQVLNQRAGSNSGSCGRRGTSLRYTWMTATSSPSHNGRLLD